MNAEAGWYYHQGDPEDTVRRWNGHEWIGFPTALPEANSALRSPERTPFKNQRRLLLWGILGGAGLIATMYTGAIVLRELIEDLQRMNDLSLEEIEVPVLTHVSENPSGSNFLLAVLGGGLLFLLWLFIADRNLGGNALGASPKGRTISSYFFERRNVLFGLFFSPVIRRVTNLIEYSGAGSRKGTMSPFGPMIWLVLWMVSVVGAGVAFLRRAEADLSVSPNSLLIVTALLAAHLLSLLFALKFVIQITVYQDRRLRG